MEDISKRLFGSNFEIIIGTNEEYLVAYKVTCETDGSLTLDSSFANKSHSGGIRKLATCGPYVISGGLDEMVHVFSMEKRIKLGLIEDHVGTITDLQHHKRYILSAAEDGKICVYREGEWNCVKKLLGHKSSINSLAIHPTGKIAISVGMDNSLITWNLIKGRKAFESRLKSIGFIVKWSIDGQKYIVAGDRKIDVYLVETAQACHSHNFDSGINDMLVIDKSLIFVGLENGNVAVYNFDSGETLQQWEAHDSRVRAMKLLPTLPNNKASKSSNYYLVTCSSDGWLKVWLLQKDNLSEAAKCISSKNSHCRITCLEVYNAELCKNNDGKSKKNKMTVPTEETTEKRVINDETSDKGNESISKTKKKTVRIAVGSDDENESSNDEDEAQVEILSGKAAMKIFGFNKEDTQSNQPAKKKKKTMKNNS